MKKHMTLQASLGIFISAFVFFGAAYSKEAPIRDVPIKLSHADKLFKKHLYQEALKEYEKLAQKSSGDVRLKSVYRAVESKALLFRYAEAAKLVLSEKLPADPLWKARFLILRTEVARSCIRQYGYSAPADVEEGSTDLTRRTKKEWHSDINADYAELWKLRSRLIEIPIADEDYFIDLSNADTRGTPTLWDFAVMLWTRYLLTEFPRAPDSEKPSALSFISQDYKGAFSASAPPASRAAAIYEDAWRLKGSGRKTARELWKIKRILIPFNHSGLTSSFPDYESALNSAVAILKKWMDSFESFTARAQGGLEAARLLNNAGKYKEVVELCKTVEKQFAGARAAKYCARMRSEIELPRLELTGHTVPPPGAGAFKINSRNLPRIYFRLYKTTPLELKKLSKDRTHRDWDILRNPGRKIVLRFLARRPDYSFSSAVKPSNPYDYVNKKIDPPELKPGIYLALACGDDDFNEGSSLMQAAITNVTGLFLIGSSGLKGAEFEFIKDPDDINAASSVTRNGFHLYAVNALTGLPEPDAQITAFKKLNWQDPEKVTLYTGDNGMAGANVTASLNYQASTRYTFDPLAKSKNSYAYWSYPASFSYYPPAPIRIFIETDRPIYRPGQQVELKVTAIKRLPRGYKVYDGKSKITVRATDTNGQELYKTQISFNAMGSASCKFTIPPGRLLGRYNIRASLTDMGHTFRGYAYFSVEEYKRPEFEVSLDDPKGAWKYGKKAKVEGEVKYYFGGPVPEAPVSYRIYRTNYVPWFCWWWLPPDWGRSEVASGQVKTGKDGKFSFVFVPKPYSGDYSHFPSRFFVEVESRDTGGRTITASKSFTAGEKAYLFDISLPAGFATEGKPYDIPVRLMNLNEKQVSGTGSYELHALEKTTPWLEDRTYWGGRFGKGRSLEELFGKVPNAEKIRSGRLSFSSKKPARALITGLKQGVYRFTVMASDPWGGQSKQSVIILAVNAAGENFSFKLPSVALPEHSTYLHGETARVLLGSDMLKGNTFVEIWAGPFLLSRRMLGAGVRVLEIPVTPDHKGGFSVRWFSAGDFRVESGQVMIEVPWKDKELSLSLKYDKQLKPGQKANWRLNAKDFKGRPAAGEAVVRIFDRSLEYYVKAGTSWTDSLYPMRGTSRDAFFSLIQYYSVPLPVKTGWIKIMLDLFRGAIKEPNPPSLRLSRSAVRGGGWLGKKLGRVMRSKLRGSGAVYHLAEEAMPPEASAGSSLAMKDKEMKKEAAPAPPAVKVRKDFSETAYFEPHLKITKGAGPFTFKAPERLTSWKVQANAVTRDLKTGSLTRETVTKKDLMVRVEIPRFFREGDRSVIKAVVHNETGRTLSGTVSISVLEDGKAASEKLLEESLPRKQRAGLPRDFTAKPHGLFTASWRVRAPKEITRFKIRAVARSGKLADAEERDLPILPSRQRLIKSIIAVLDGTGDFKLAIDAFKEKDPTRINEAMHLQIDPQIALSILNSLPFLVRYPYECTEQLINRYVPLAIVNSFYKKYPALSTAVKKIPKRTTITPAWDRNDPRRMTSLMETPWESISKGRKSCWPVIDMLNPKLVAREKAGALKKLKALQLPGGGFPWFGGGRPDPYITLVILSGFAEAQRYGVKAPRKLVKRALKYVNREIPRYMKPNTRSISMILYAAYVVTSFPESGLQSKQAYKFAKLWVDYADKHSRAMTAFGKAYAAYVYFRLGETQKANSYLDRAMDGARQDPIAGVYWTPEKISWLWYNDSVEKHAFILRTLLALRPGDTRIPGMVQWLLFNRKGNEWKSTKASAAAIYSLLDVLKSRGALDKGDSFRINWAGDIKLASVEPFQWLSKPLRWTLTGQEISPAHGDVKIKKRGPGLAFASLTWIYSTGKLPKSSGEGMLELKRKFFLRYKKGGSYSLKPIAGGDTVGVGDQIEIHLVIKARSQFEYVHLKDLKGAGFEAETLTSGWKWDMLSRYEEPRDSLTNFFMDWLPHGEYILRYKVRPTTPGTYRIGAAVLQSMYAPEMSAHSSGIILNVK